MIYLFGKVGIHETKKLEQANYLGKLKYTKKKYA